MDEFVVTVPYASDWIAIQQESKYALRYVQHLGRLSFGLVMVVKPGTGGKDIQLALFENLRPPDMDVETFEKLEWPEKIKIASKIKAVEMRFAQVLYDTWVRVLMRSRYGNGGRSSTGSELYYLSSYSITTGFMCASNTEQRPGKTTGRIVEISNLLRQYLLTNEESKSEDLEAQIRTLCAKVE